MTTSGTDEHRYARLAIVVASPIIIAVLFVWELGYHLRRAFKQTWTATRAHIAGVREMIEDLR